MPVLTHHPMLITASCNALLDAIDELERITQYVKYPQSVKVTGFYYSAITKWVSDARETVLEIKSTL